jgi:heat shock protein HslJ/uncharacterized membrane protein
MKRERLLATLIAALLAGATTGCAAPQLDGQPARRDALAGPWEEARRRGVEFRAVGQEPGWVLEIDEGRLLRYAGDYGATHLSAPAPEPVVDSTGAARFEVSEDGRALVATVRPEPCQDAMSGEAFTHAVTVRTGGQDLDGCGRLLATDDLVGRYWKLRELAGTAVDDTSPLAPHLRLLAEGARFAGATGCNRVTGSYELDGARLRFGPAATTRMACLDPAASAREQRLLGVLEAVDRMEVQNDRLTLFTSAGARARFVAVPLR